MEQKPERLSRNGGVLFNERWVLAVQVKSTAELQCTTNNVTALNKLNCKAITMVDFMLSVFFQS